MTLARRPGITVRTRVREYAGDRARSHEDHVITEEPLEIRVATPTEPARRLWVTMRTPGHDFELAAGFAWHEGITTREGIRQVAYCTDATLAPEQEFNVVTLTLAHPVEMPERAHQLHSSGSSACGVCGKDSISAALSARAVRPWSGVEPDPALVRLLPGRLRERQTAFARTGGAHAAGLATESGELLVVREDVGRHNAVDKVAGARLLAGEDPAAAYLIVSGRAGFELVQKAVASGIGALVAVGAPTSVSVALARESGLALFGFTGPERTVRYA